MTSTQWGCPSCGHTGTFTIPNPRCFLCGWAMVPGTTPVLRADVIDLDVAGPEVTEAAHPPSDRTRQWRRKRISDIAAGLARTGMPSGIAAERAADSYDWRQGQWNKTCPVCKEQFWSKRSDKATCSATCRQKRARANRD